MFQADMDHLQALLSCFGVFQIILGRFGPYDCFWAILGFSGRFRLFNIVQDCIGSLSGPFQAVWKHFRLFRVVSGSFETFWDILSQFELLLGFFSVFWVLTDCI
jgi:hypothetical protein